MDFIDRWLHVSTDGGNGSLEFLIVASGVLAVVVAVAAARRHASSKCF